MENELKGQATPEQIAEWKAKNKDVFAITVDGHVAYLKSPDRKTMSYASVGGAKDPIKFNEILLKGCWLGGSAEIQTDDDLFFAAGGKLAEIIQVKEAELVKL
jgi:hypothetical protein